MIDNIVVVSRIRLARNISHKPFSNNTSTDIIIVIVNTFDFFFLSSVYGDIILFPLVFFFSNLVFAF